jgi:hypothetical protein
MTTIVSLHGQEFKFHRILSFEDLKPLWAFFLAGLSELNERAPQRRRLDPPQLLQTVLRAISLGPALGLVGVVSSKNDKPLSWGVAFDNTIKNRPRSCVVFGVYSNGKSPFATKVALNCLKEWARANEYQEIQAFSWNFSGSSFRLFERVWGFRRAATLFTQEL